VARPEELGSDPSIDCGGNEQGQGDKSGKYSMGFDGHFRWKSGHVMTCQYHLYWVIVLKMPRLTTGIKNAGHILDIT
jgi:hypothetical protein